jgi:ATP-dependent RNA helicase DeaD
MGRIKRGEVAFMVATDLAARGIDISDLGHVINYSLPEDAAVYLHRVGRTGRIGKKGTAINLTSGRELATLTTLEKKYSIKFDIRTMPSAEVAAHMWSERHVKQLKEAAQGSIYEGFLALASTLKLRPDADELIAFMLKSFFAHQRMERAQAPAGEAGEVRELPQKVETRRDKGPRRERERERPERGERRDRPPRRDKSGFREDPGPEVSVHDAKTAPGGSDAVARKNGDRELFAQHEQQQAATPGAGIAVPAVSREKRPPRAEGGKKKLSDRELFELLQAGKPLPPLEDPTTGHDDSAAVASEGGERRERKERRPRREEKPVEVPAGVARLWLNLGKGDAADEGSLVSALETMGAPSGKITKAEVRGTYSYVYVAEGDAAAFESLAGKQHNTKALKIERARR